jgi:WD40 repeat protein
MECLCIAFMEDGKSIISGWSDGKIRAFGPQTGKLLYTITDAHVHGVTAIVGTSDSTKIVSGGKEGQVRAWSSAKFLDHSRFGQTE